MTTAVLSGYKGVDQQFMELDVIPRQKNYVYYQQFPSHSQ
jgi:hypothetical protein